jgi:RNA polymerase sigma-70 factor (ECF subfamily)
MQISDEELVARAVATGDAAAFARLVERHQSAVRNWLRQLCRDPAQSDDLAQETFLAAWRNLRSFAGQGRVSSWLLKIAYRAWLQAGRREGRRRRLGEALGATDPPGTPEPGARTDLERMLAVLTQDERRTLILCYAHGLSHGEIADVMDLPLGTVKSHIRRGGAKIRERFP